MSVSVLRRRVTEPVEQWTRRVTAALLVTAGGLLAGCASEPPKASAEAATVAAPAPAPVVAVPLAEAVRRAAEEMFAKAPLEQGRKYTLIIDPLVDGNTGVQTVATAGLERSVAEIARTGFPQLELKPFSSEAVAAQPLVMVGTFTPINLLGKADGERDAYRICFALADLRSGKILSKGFARAQPAGVDATPRPFFQDMPVWIKDAAVDGYVKTCQGTKAGDPIHPAYVDSVLAAATINEARQAYEVGQYKEAIDLLNAVQANPAGRQARVLAGLYMAQNRLKQQKAASASFAKLVEMGLAGERLAVRFGFKPGGTAFAGNPQQYTPWLKEIGKQALASPGCVEVAGHTPRSGSPQLDERLSLQRAEYVLQKMGASQPAFTKRARAQGYGSAQALVGTGKGDGSDALDERIEFRKVGCS